mgnify:FL=1
MKPLNRYIDYDVKERLKHLGVEPQFLPFSKGLPPPLGLETDNI